MKKIKKARKAMSDNFNVYRNKFTEVETATFCHRKEVAKVGRHYGHKKIGFLCKLYLYEKNLSRVFKRYPKLYDLVVKVRNIKGCIVECGTYKGGSASVFLKANNGIKWVWLFDSFEGCPEPTQEDIDFKGRKATCGDCKATQEELEIFLFKKSEFVIGTRDRCKIIKGWFIGNLPKYKERIGNISSLHIDCDWYESTKEVLEELYDLVVPNGVIIIDDYGPWLGCRKAVNDFFKKRNIKPNLKKIDYTSYYMKK